MDRLSDFKLGMGIIVKADKDWRGVGWPQVAMHSQLPRFLVGHVVLVWIDHTCNEMVLVANNCSFCCVTHKLYVGQQHSSMPCEHMSLKITRSNDMVSVVYLSLIHI